MKPWVVEAGVNVIDAPFIAHGNIATAGGCLASQYLATWMIARGASLRDAEEAMHYVAPVGEKALYVGHALGVIAPFVEPAQTLAAQPWRIGLLFLVGGARVRALIMAGARMQIALRICGAAYPYTCRRVGAL